MLLEFMKIEYHEKLDFAKFEYLKSGKCLHISETVVDCNIICEKVLFGYFCHCNLVVPTTKYGASQVMSYLHIFIIGVP